MKVSKPLITWMIMNAFWVWTSWSPFPSALKLTLNLSMSTFCTSHEVFAETADFTSKEGRWVLSLNEEFGKTAKGQREGSYSFWGSNIVKLSSWPWATQVSCPPPSPRLRPFIGLLVVWETRPWAFGGATWTAELMQPQGKSLRWVGLGSEWLIDFECWSSPGFH